MDENKNPKKKNKFKIDFKRINFIAIAESLQQNGRSLLYTALAAFVVMVFVAVVVFIVNLRGPEKVLVPDVRGKELATALLELQVKELYPRIQLRFSDSADDAGKILEQSPKAGAIVKGYSRVSLVVSRGMVTNQIGNYVGQQLDAVQIQLQTLFAGHARPLIVLATPEYKPHNSEAGTILEQDPPAGTGISSQTAVHVVVSRGPDYETVSIPNLVGSSVGDVIQQMARNRLVFNFSSHFARENETAGTVVSQQKFMDERVQVYTRVNVEFAFPTELVDGNVYGIFTETLPSYPYPLPITLTAYPQEGNSYIVASFNHPGELCTIPYVVPKGTTLVLSSLGKDVKTIIADGEF